MKSICSRKKGNIKVAGIAVLLLLFCVAHTAHAEIVELDVGNGITATARYAAGNNETPAILILHGFLQTRDFYTVMRLSTGLEDLGYTVLVPTLSLGVDRRKKSLACEAVHTHSLGSDMQEIGLWIEWLNKKTGTAPVVIGHSVGALLLLAQIDQAPKPTVSDAILISLPYFGWSPIANETVADAERAKAFEVAGKSGLDTYRLAYCKKYPTTAQNFLSYYEWSREKVLFSLQELIVPSSIIFGSEDKRIDEKWVSTMKKAGVNVILIPGANHFFDDEYEFELTDRIEVLLSKRR